VRHKKILVTGGTGTLGRALVRRLVQDGHEVRVASRRLRPAHDRDERYSWAVVDLRSGHGVDAAVTGVDVIIHSATSPRRGAEVTLTRTLLEAVKRAGSPHLIYISIVGVDRIPLRYYQDKLAAEQLIAESGLPYTILRATQFHDLVRYWFTWVTWPPVALVPTMRFQPIDVRDVADRLAELVVGEPAGRVPDIGGPQVHHTRELARSYLQATGRRRLIVPVRVPGRTFRAFRQGHNLTENAVDGVTFEEYLATPASH